MNQPLLKHFEVVVEPTKIEATLSAHVGRLEVHVGDDIFPEEGWSDFVVVVLGWFAQAADNLNEKNAVVVDFMDGPFELKMTAAGDTVQLRAGTRNRTPDLDELVDRNQLVQSILLAGDAVLAALDADDRHSDVQALRASLDPLR